MLCELKYVRINNEYPVRYCESGGGNRPMLLSFQNMRMNKA